MPIDKKAFIEKYVLENQDIIARVYDAILYLEKFPNDQPTINELMRHFHTIKGTSKMMGFAGMSNLSHRCEDIISFFHNRGTGISPEEIDFFIKLVDVLKKKLHSIKKSEEFPIDSFISEMASAIESEEIEKLISELKFPQTEPEKNKESIAPIEKRGLETDMIRIKPEKLDSVIRDINEVMIYYLNVKTSTKRLHENIVQLKRITSLSKDEARDLYRRLNGIYRGFKDHLGKIEIYISQIQDAMLNLKMLPISILFDQIPRAAREIARQLNKRVEVIIESENSYLDKNIIEKFDEPLIHIIRNCIAHGIELPDERREKQKNEVGTLRIKSNINSGNVLTRISDDGRGMDIERIKESAVKAGVFTKEQLDELPDEEIINLIFLPEISTSSGIDDVAGRGIGMNIIRESIEELKGSISITTKKDEGTEISILLPLTLSTIPSLFVLVNGIIFAIPISYIDEVVAIGEKKIINVSKRVMFKFRQKVIKAITLNKVLSIDTESKQAYKYILIMKSIDRQLGIFIHDIVNEADAVVKTVPPHLKNVKTIMGVTINNINEVSNILHVPSIIEAANEESTIITAKQLISARGQRGSILVVDDTESIRDIHTDYLSGYGFSIDTAPDGHEALTMLKAHDYAVVITDIQMPVMDGFSLIKSIRMEERLKNIPVVVISTLTDRDTLSTAKSLGANKYLIKGKYKKETLVRVVKGLMR